MTASERICWHDAELGYRNGAHDCPAGAWSVDEMVVWQYGRCRSGRRWFWAAQAVGLADGLVVTYGREAGEVAALAAARQVVREQNGTRLAVAYLCHGAAASTLKRVNAQKRASRPASETAEPAIAECLYEANIFTPEIGPDRRTVIEWPIARKTAKRIYFADGGYVSREELESDTRCWELCREQVTIMVCGRHGEGSPHCVHRDMWRLPAICRSEAGCGAECPREIPETRCLKHDRTSDHCVHGNSGPHGYPAGEMLRSGQGWWDFVHLFSDREAAEAALFGAERDREAEQVADAPEIRRLRRAMADAHPDRGGTSDGFIAARQRYESALKATR